jgi:short-subunit dehydrogenase
MTEEAAETWIVLGASSPIGRAFAREVARPGTHVILAGRDVDDLARTASDIRIAGQASVEVSRFDATDLSAHGKQAAHWAERPGTLNAILLFGTMPQQADIDADPALVLDCIASTYAGALSILHHLATHLEARKAGTVIGIGSVAGDRGRLKNYVYGSAKAGLHTYLAGLRNRLGRSNVHVMTVKLGFVDTGMTWGQPGLFLVASPEAVARRCLVAARKRRDVCYIPAFWLPIMTIIRSIPERIFKRLSI